MLHIPVMVVILSWRTYLMSFVYLPFKQIWSKIFSLPEISDSWPWHGRNAPKEVALCIQTLHHFTTLRNWFTHCCLRLHHHQFLYFCLQYRGHRFSELHKEEDCHQPVQTLQMWISPLYLPDAGIYFRVITFIVKLQRFTESGLLIIMCSCFPSDDIPLCCKHGCGIKQRYFLAFFGSCNFLQELADKVLTIFVFQKPNYPFVSWLWDQCFVDQQKFHSYIY